jgi:hypothetical protein
VIVQDAPEPFRKLPATRTSAAPLSERQHQKYEQRKAEKKQEKLIGGFLELPDEPFHRPQSSPASRLTAGAAGFFDFIQCRERPERQGAPSLAFSTEQANNSDHNPTSQ